MMKKFALIAAAVGTLTVPCAAHASVIDTLSDWGINTSVINGADDVAASNYATNNGLGAGFVRVVEDYVGSGGYVGPNYGGQRYDLEALYVRQSGNILTVAGITGALWNDAGAANFGIGDLFIGTRVGTGSASFTGYGIELTGGMYTMNASGSTTGTVTNDYTQMGSLHAVTSGVGYADGIASSRDSDWRTAPGQLVNQGISGGDGYNDGTSESPSTWLANSVASISWEQFSGNRHSAFIAQIDLTSMLPTISNSWNNTILIHWGEVCGNDYLELNYQLDGGSVPEPASMLLFGTALLGLAGFRRRRFG